MKRPSESELDGDRRVALRAQARRLIGPTHALVELDESGRVVFSSGSWVDAAGAPIAAASDLTQLVADGDRDPLRAVLARPSRETTEFSLSLLAQLDTERESGSPCKLVVSRIEAPHAPGIHTLVGLVGESLGSFSQLAGAPAAVENSPLAATEQSGSPPPMWTGFRQRTDRWLASRELTWNQVGVAALVVFAAFVLRTWDLSELPVGIHGDEALMGVDARRIVLDGWIGIYTPEALGQPTAPMYFTAPFEAFFGPSAFAVRIGSAVAGTLTVALIYLVAQRRFGHEVGVAAAVVLAAMPWSLHFSRIGFPLAWWPLTVLAAAALIDRAGQSGRRRDWALGGFAAAFGVYVYNSHWVWGAAVFVAVASWYVIGGRYTDRRISTLIWGPIAAGFTLVPMFRYMVDPTKGYGGHFRLVRRTNTPDWEQASWLERIGDVATWYAQAWKYLVWSPIPDGGDASGVIRQVPLVVAFFAIIGLLVVLYRNRTLFMAIALATIAVMPIAPAITVNGYVRRAYAMAPFLAILAGVGVVAAITLVRGLHVPSAAVLTVGVVAGLLLTSVVPYFTTFRDDGFQKWVFVEELESASQIIEQNTDRQAVFVNWYSGRHYIDYSSLTYRLPGLQGANRAPLDQGFADPMNIDLWDTPRAQLFLLIGPYVDQIDALVQRYPQGEIVARRQSPPVAGFLVPAP